MNKRELLDDLIAVVAETLTLVVGSRHEGWGQARSTSEVAEDLRRHLRRLEHHTDLSDLFKLRVLFAPTGTLQELSMANDWSDRYLVLAARFDALTGG